MTITNQEVEQIATRTVKKERSVLAVGVIIFLVSQIFMGGILYAQVQGNSKGLIDSKDTIQQVPLIIQKLEVVKEKGNENTREIKDVQRSQQEILLELRGISQQIKNQAQ